MSETFAFSPIVVIDYRIIVWQGNIMPVHEIGGANRGESSLDEEQIKVLGQLYNVSQSRGHQQ